ncbi:YbbC/YhhH family protein [Pontibacter sp. G13]|uniref:YbbC/YhhH family protein n=1 Tax=Pontibacter sp. G13 TaxID=3074898 RepID=UPI00288ADC2B|nr:YbbC/YhhH family protein [Pontibacter sp. G13]WNJ18249.1 YbbC/YhhH family protein [Pontibacter sp. G13]
MRRYIFLPLLLILGFSLSTFSQELSRNGINEAQAKSILQASLADSSLHNTLGTTTLLSEETEAVDFAEKVLFKIYGRKSIRSQKPYQSYLIDEYWVISGTLPKNMKGGTFLIIIDSRDNRVIRITHGK